MNWLTLEHRGWPGQTVFSVRLNQGDRSGPAADGDVEIFMQKGDDATTAVSIDTGGGNNLAAQVRNGQWSSTPLDLANFRQQGFDTLAAVHQGRRVLRTLDRVQRQQGQAPGNNQQPNANPRGAQQANTSYELRFECSSDDHKGVPVKDRDDKVSSYKLPLSVAIIRSEGKKKQPAKNVRFRLFRDQIPVGPAEGFETNDDGHRKYTVSNIPPGGDEGSGVVLLKCRVVEGPLDNETILAEKSINVEVPVVEETRTPKSLTAHATEPRKEKGRYIHRVTLVAEDQKKRNIGVGLVQWECGAQNGAIKCNEGYVSFEVELITPGEHTFIARSKTANLTSNPLKLSGPPKPEPPKLKVVGSKDGRWKTFSITYGVEDSPVSATLEVWPTRGCSIAFREAGQTDWTTATGKTKISTAGRTVLQVKIDKLAPGVGGDNVFVGVKGTIIQSGPHYVSGNL